MPPNSELLGEGYSSRAYQLGSQVLKVSKASWPIGTAYGRIDRLQSEEASLLPYVEENLVPAYYGVARSDHSPGKAHVVITQRLVSGVGVAEFLDAPGVDTEPLVRFLSGCLRMYKDTGDIPDIASMFSGFDFARTKNVIIDTSDDVAGHPVLVDPHRGVLQCAGPLRAPLNRGIFSGVKRALVGIA